MKTLEAAYILPIIFAITGFIIIWTFKTHDAVISKSLQYGILVEQAASLENPYYAPAVGYTKNNIADIIYDSSLVNNRSSFSSCLSGDVLYLQDNRRNNCIPIFFSNYERCDTIRKETALILQYIDK